MGPVSAITALSNILLVIVEAIRNVKAPTWVEIIALILGFVGGIELVFPEIFEKSLGIFKKSLEIRKRSFGILRNP